MDEIYSHQEQRQDAGLPYSTVIRTELLLRHEKFKVDAISSITFVFPKEKKKEKKMGLHVNFRISSLIIVKNLVDSLFHLIALLAVLCLVT